MYVCKMLQVNSLKFSSFAGLYFKIKYLVKSKGLNKAENSAAYMSNNS